MVTLEQQLDEFSNYLLQVKKHLKRWKVKNFKINLGIVLHSYVSSATPDQCAIEAIRWNRVYPMIDYEFENNEKIKEGTAGHD